LGEKGRGEEGVISRMKMGSTFFKKGGKIEVKAFYAAREWDK